MTEANRPNSHEPADQQARLPGLRVAAFQKEWKAEAQALGKLATAFGSLSKAKAYEAMPQLVVLIDRVESKIKGLSVAERGVRVLDELRQDVKRRQKQVQERLGLELKEACGARDLTMTVVSRENPLEVRIPPFAIKIDREKFEAQVLFARLAIERSSAEADTIMRAYDKALASMQRGFEPGQFFDNSLSAWKAARGAGYGGEGGRVEILDFLPYLALQQQSKSFRVEPSERNYRGYSRARFAFDVNQLRKAGISTRDGWRMHFGVATGTTAMKKDRSIFIEDGRGNGEFQLTVYFKQAGLSR